MMVMMMTMTITELEWSAARVEGAKQAKRRPDDPGTAKMIRGMIRRRGRRGDREGSGEPRAYIRERTSCLDCDG